MAAEFKLELTNVTGPLLAQALRKLADTVDFDGLDFGHIGGPLTDEGGAEIGRYGLDQLAP